MRRRKHMNADDVLPRELVDQISAALGGRPSYLWIPSRAEIKRGARNRHVLQLYGEGLRVDDIAKRVFLSERTIWRILTKARAASAPSDHGLDTKPSNPQRER